MNCNFVRDYGLTKVYVTAPNVSEITNNSEFTVHSIGVLNYPNLRFDFRRLYETRILY